MQKYIYWYTMKSQLFCSSIFHRFVHKRLYLECINLFLFVKFCTHILLYIFICVYTYYIINKYNHIFHKYIMFNGNYNIILKNSTIVWAQVICYTHNTYFQGPLPELGLHSYKVGNIFATYRKMWEKWICWDGPCLSQIRNI